MKDLIEGIKILIEKAIDNCENAICDIECPGPQGKNGCEEYILPPMRDILNLLKAQNQIFDHILKLCYIKYN